MLSTTFGNPVVPVQANFDYSSNRDSFPTATGEVRSDTTPPRYLHLQPGADMVKGDWIKLSVTFTGRVWNPSLTLVHIDRNAFSPWDDWVVLEPASFVVSNKSANLLGVGRPFASGDNPAEATVGPFRSTSERADPTSKLTAAWQGAVEQGQPISVIYSLGVNLNLVKDQRVHIGVSQIAFDLCS